MDIFQRVMSHFLYQELLAKMKKLATKVNIKLHVSVDYYCPT